MTLSKAAQAERDRRTSQAAVVQAAAAQEPTEAEPESVPDAVEFAPLFAEGRVLAEGAAEALAEPEAGADLADFVTLFGPVSYGPVKVNGQVRRVGAGAPIRVTDPKEREALLAMYCFRPTTALDFAPPYSGPITTAQLRGGGARDPEQI